LSAALKIYLGLFSGLWFLAFLIVGVRRYILHAAYPLNTFLYSPGARFWDFTVYAPRFAQWGHGDLFYTLPGFPFNYPAPLLIAELVYYKLSHNALYAYLGTVILFAAVSAIYVAFAMPRERRVRDLAGVVALASALLSFPLMFLIDRGNIEGLVWMAASLGLLFFITERYRPAAILLGLAASMKIFPGLLLLLFLAKRRYRDFALSLGAFAAFTFGSLWAAGPNPIAAARFIARGMEHFRQDQVLEFKPFEAGFDHSLFAFLKQIVFRALHDVSRVNAVLPKLYLVYCAAAVGGFVLIYAARVRRLPVLNQILALSALSILLPYVSYDYTLVHMFAPFSALVTVLAADASRGLLRLTLGKLLFLLLPFAVIFTPQTYLVASVVGYDGQVKALALVAVIAAALAIPLPSTLFNELRERETIQLDLEVKQPSRQPELAA
jgi:hypothetical protein